MAIRVPGLLLPLWTPDGLNPVSVYRPDNPRVIEEKDQGKNPDGTYPNRVMLGPAPTRRRSSGGWWTAPTD